MIVKKLQLSRKIKIVNIEDELYPEKLRKIKNPPLKLYTLGNLELLKTNTIAIIGSRSCSEKGEILARKFATELVEQGITIVSGLAKRN